MNVTGISDISEPQDSKGVRRTTSQNRQNSPSSTQKTSSDQVTISEEAKNAQTMTALINQVNKLPDLRKEIVDKIKLEISEGKYLTDDKIDKTAEEILKFI